MSEKQVRCFHCQSINTFQDRLSFRAECDPCGSDLHVCKNCSFYKLTAYNECLEPSAEKVQDKESRNVCEYFKASSFHESSDQNTEDIMKQAEDLFKKK